MKEIFLWQNKAFKLFYANIAVNRFKSFLGEQESSGGAGQVRHKLAISEQHIPVQDLEPVLPVHRGLLQLLRAASPARLAPLAHPQPAERHPAGRHPLPECGGPTAPAKIGKSFLLAQLLWLLLWENVHIRITSSSTY